MIMQAFWDTVTGAPWWVYLLFIVLLNLGIKSLKKRILPIQRVYLLPIVFLAWSFADLYGKYTEKHTTLPFVWAICLAIGIYFGVMSVRFQPIHHDRRKKEITVPGSPYVLILVLLIFILKFIWGYYYSTYADVSYWIYFADTATSVLISGFFTGRAVFYLKSYYSKRS